MSTEPHPLDAVGPSQIARLVEDVGVRKVSLGFIPTLTLAILAGAFIAFGAMFYTLVITGSELGFGPTRLLGGAAFSLGLVLVIIRSADAQLVHMSGILSAGDGAAGATAEAIALAKTNLDPLQAFVRAILCNVLVCLAVWMCFAAHSVSGKVIVSAGNIVGGGVLAALVYWLVYLRPDRT